MPRTAFDCLASATRMAFPSTVCARMNVGAGCALKFTDSVVRVANTAGLFAGGLHGTKGRLLGLGLAAAGGNSVQSLHCLIPVREIPGKCRSQSTNAAERVIIESPSKAPWLRSMAMVLNRLRTGVGRFSSSMLKWGLKDSSICECGAPEQTVDHILYICPQHRP